MDFAGKVTIQAPIEKVWSGLTDPNLVSQCAPGLQSMKVLVPEKEFNVVATVGFGVIRLTFNVDVQFTEKNPPGYARVKAHGQAPGNSVDVLSDMRLTSTGPNTTDLDWTAGIAMVGSIAGLANRLMGGVTRQLSAQFFDCIKTRIEEAATEAR